MSSTEVLKSALKAQNGFERPDGTLYFGSSGTVDPTAVANALKAAGYAVMDVESADELTQLRVCMDRLMALADRWMSHAGPGSKAETVYGEQVVTVRFAVDNIRAALNAEDEP